MKRIVILAGTLLIALAGLSLGARLAGQTSIEWPLSSTNRLPMPTDAPYDGLLPNNVGGFARQQFDIPIVPISGGRILAEGSAQYSRPGDTSVVYLDLQRFASRDVALLAVNPANWHAYSPTIKHFFGSVQTIAFMLTATNDYHQDYTLAYVSGSWDVTMNCNNLQALLTFANNYPY